MLQRGIPAAHLASTLSADERRRVYACLNKDLDVQCLGEDVRRAVRAGSKPGGPAHASKTLRLLFVTPELLAMPA